MEDLNDKSSIKAELKDVPELLERGMSLFFEGKYKEALSEFETINSLEPYNFAAHARRGACLYHLGDMERATSAIAECLKLHPQCLPARHYQGRIYRALGKDRQADAELNKAAEIYQSYADEAVRVFSAGQFSNAVVILSELMLISPKSSRLYFERGTAYMQLEQFDKAIDDFSVTLKYDSHNAQALERSGWCYRALERNDLAASDWQRALLLNPENASLLADNARLLNDRNEVEAALEQVNRAVEIAPKDAKVRSARAAILSNLDRFDDALADHDESIRLTGENALQLTNRAVTKALAYRFEDAIADLEKIVAMNSSFHLAQVLIAKCYSQLHEPKKALDTINKVLKADSEVPGGLAVRAELWHRMGETNAAIADCKAALSKNSSDQKVIVQLAFYTAFTGKYHRALEAVSEVIARDNHNALAFATRAGINHSIEAVNDANADVIAALAIDERCAAAWFVQGLVHSAEGQLDEATMCFNKTMKVKNRCFLDDINSGLAADCLAELGYVNASASRNEEAKKDWQRALNLFVDPALVHLRMAQSCLFLGQTDLIFSHLKEAERYITNKTSADTKHQIRRQMETYRTNSTV